MRSGFLHSAKTSDISVRRHILNTPLLSLMVTSIVYATHTFWQTSYSGNSVEVGYHYWLFSLKLTVNVIFSSNG